MREIKTYSKGAPFYNAFLRPYPILVADYFRIRRQPPLAPFNCNLIGALTTNYVKHIQTHAFWIGPPSTSAQNWRVAGLTTRAHRVYGMS